MDKLKEILGEQLYNELKELAGEELNAKIGEILKDKKVLSFNEADEIAVTNNGEWIPKEKFNSILEDKKTFKTQAEQYQNELAELKKSVKDNSELTAQISELENKMQTNAQSFEQREAEAKKRFALAIALRDSGAKFPDLLEQKFDLSKLELSDDGKIRDFDTVLNPVKESYKDLFGEQKKAGFDPARNQNPDGFYSKEQIDALTTEQLADPKILEKVNQSLSKLN